MTDDPAIDVRTRDPGQLAQAHPAIVALLGELHARRIVLP